MIQKFCNMLSTFILIMVLGVLCALLVPRMFGYEMFTVLSGSMEPTFPVGSIVYVDKLSADRIKVGDPIAFHIEKKTIATHRVVKIDNKNRIFTTKGDANDSADSRPVTFEQLIGKATVSIPLLGYISVNLKTVKGVVVSCGILIILTIVLIVPDLMKRGDVKKGKREEEKV